MARNHHSHQANRDDYDLGCRRNDPNDDLNPDENGLMNGTGANIILK